MVELIDHGYPLDTTHNDLLAEIAADLDVGVIASNNVHYAQPHNGRLAAAVAAVRARRSLEELDGWLPPAPTAFVRTGAEMGRRFRRYPGAVQRAALLGLECAFDLKLVAPELPPFPVPDGPHGDHLAPRARRAGRGPPLRVARRATRRPTRSSTTSWR